MMISSGFHFNPKGACGDPDLARPENTHHQLCSQDRGIVRTLHGLLPSHPLWDYLLLPEQFALEEWEQLEGETRSAALWQVTSFIRKQNTMAAHILANYQLTHQKDNPWGGLVYFHPPKAHNYKKPQRSLSEQWGLTWSWSTLEVVRSSHAGLM